MEIQNDGGQMSSVSRLGGKHFLESWIKGQLDDIIDQFHVWCPVKDAIGYEGGMAYRVPCPNPSRGSEAT